MESTTEKKTSGAPEERKIEIGTTRRDNNARTTRFASQRAVERRLDGPTPLWVVVKPGQTESKEPFSD